MRMGRFVGGAVGRSRLTSVDIANVSLPSNDVAGPDVPHNDVAGPDMPCNDVTGPNMPCNDVTGPDVPCNDATGPDVASTSDTTTSTGSTTTSTNTQAARHWAVPCGTRPSAKLIVEVDGGYHSRRVGVDARRDAKLARARYRVIHVPAELVLRDLPRALSIIRTALATPVP